MNRQRRIDASKGSHGQAWTPFEKALLMSMIPLRLWGRSWFWLAAETNAEGARRGIPEIRNYKDRNCGDFFRRYREASKAEWGEDVMKAQAYLMAIDGILALGKEVRVDFPAVLGIDSDASPDDNDLDADIQDPDNQETDDSDDDDNLYFDKELVYGKGAGLDSMEVSFLLS